MDFSLCFPTRTSNNIAIFLLNFDDVCAVKRNSRCIAIPNLNVVSFISIFSAQTKWVPIHCKSKWIKCWRYSNSSPRCRCGRSTNTCNSRIVASRRNFEHILPKCRCKGNGFTIVVRSQLLIHFSWFSFDLQIGHQLYESRNGTMEHHSSQNQRHCIGFRLRSTINQQWHHKSNGRYFA